MKHSRHTFASDMIRAGISLPALMQLMGHVLPRALHRRFTVLFYNSRLAKPGQESAQYASIAAADSIVPFMML